MLLFDERMSHETGLVTIKMTDREAWLSFLLRIKGLFASGSQLHNKI